MRPIPPQLREEMAQDNYYSKCCIRDEKCSGRIEWHHALIFAGRQVNEKFCILPVCHFHHEHEKDKELHEKLTYIWLCRASSDDLERFSKGIDYKAMYVRLRKKYDNNT